MMPDQLMHTEVGYELPARVRVTTTAQLVRYSGAAQDFSAIHHDAEYARRRGFDGVIVHGFLKAAFLAELGQDWAGPEAWYRTFGARYQGTDLVVEPGRRARPDQPGPVDRERRRPHHDHGNRSHPDRRSQVTERQYRAERKVKS
jgi:hypothetical protein